MEKEKFFLIGKISTDSIWQVITLMTEDYNEAYSWYEHKVMKKNSLYVDVKISKTIYG